MANSSSTSCIKLQLLRSLHFQSKSQAALYSHKNQKTAIKKAIRRAEIGYDVKQLFPSLFFILFIYLKLTFNDNRWEVHKCLFILTTIYLVRDLDELSERRHLYTAVYHLGLQQYLKCDHHLTKMNFIWSRKDTRKKFIFNFYKSPHEGVLMTC